MSGGRSTYLIDSGRLRRLTARAAELGPIRIRRRWWNSRGMPTW